ncbi:uncharacterized protein LOC106011717 [Aplysia californica]|uniref:Uncharacterized protein LOC106011717 n=1 Tax=Aplysia californica TaxID=6500 RepID=A0ABM0ZZI0_APLCA|nr:uncharacterized protein LOC106011717 [Aplysia californica]
MTTGLDTTNLEKTEDIRKTAIIDRELTRLNVDITALQETRLANSGTIRERNYTFFWKGLGEDERRIHGVGFAVHNRLLNRISTLQGISERITVMEMETKTGKAHFISAYAPTLTTENEKKTSFTRNFRIQSTTSQKQTSCFSWATSMQEQVLKTKYGPPALDRLGWEKSTRMVRDS